MKSILITVVCVVLALSMLSLAQTGKPNSYTRLMEYEGFVPNSATDLVAKTVQLQTIQLTTESAADVTCIITAKTSGRSIYGSATAPGYLASGSTMVMQLNDRTVEGGLRWHCSAASAVNAYVAWKEQ